MPEAPSRLAARAARVQMVAAELCLGARPRGDLLRVEVRGGCMEPVLADGDRVTVDARASLRPGDVVAVVGVDGWLRVHRLLGVLPSRRGALAVTCADRAAAVDPPVSRVRVLGVVLDLRVPLLVRGRALVLLGVVLVRAFARRLRSLVARRALGDNA